MGSDCPACSSTYASLNVFPGEADPATVTAALSLVPSKVQRRGETAWGGGRKATLHGWFLSTKGQVESDDFGKHLDWLLARLADKEAAVRDLTNAGMRVEVSVYWQSLCGHGGPALRPDQMAALGRMGIAIWFDVYFLGRIDED